MDDPGSLLHELGEALRHLHVPDYCPADVLRHVVGCGPDDAPIVVRTRIIEAIKALEPPPDAHLDTRGRRDYDILYHRYILKLTQEETAERLYLGLRTVQRGQEEAICTLAQRLSEGRPVPTTAEDAGPMQERQATSWRTQSRAELDVLHAQAPESEADLSEVLVRVLKIGTMLFGERGVRVSVGHAQPGLVAAVHPVVLSQLMITSISRLTRHVLGGEITIYAVLDQASVNITLTGPVAAGQALDLCELTDDLIVPETCTVEAAIQGNHVFLQICVPSVGEIRVLAIDDNADVLHFYRRATAGTRFHIVYTNSGKDALECIRSAPPDIIILDVMLPDMDGWTLLMQLHENTATRSVPIVICSVVREEDLAYSLGAALYLHKPVEPDHLVAALEQLRSQVPTAAPRAP